MAHDLKSEEDCLGNWIFQNRSNLFPINWFNKMTRFVQCQGRIGLVRWRLVGFFVRI